MLRRRPVLRAAAGTAVIAGTAAAVGGRVRHRQNRRWQEQADAEAYQQPPQPQAPPPPVQAAAPTMSTVEQLKELAALRDQGVVNDAEFEAEKAKILQS